MSKTISERRPAISRVSKSKNLLLNDIKEDFEFSNKVNNTINYAFPFKYR